VKVTAAEMKIVLYTSRTMFESLRKEKTNDINQFEKLEHARDGWAENEVTSETFHFFRDTLENAGYTEYKSMNEAYATLPPDTLIVRREDPRQILKLFSKEAGYEIGFEDDRYSNCVEWNPKSDGVKNIHNAYMEGFTNLNSVVAIVGLEKNDNDDIEHLPDATANFHGLDRRGVRSFQGSVTLEKVQFINLRIPGHLMQEADLTEDEIERVDNYLEAKENDLPAQPVMVHRSYVLDEPQIQKEAA
jgi:hypothetical protein